MDSKLYVLFNMAMVALAKNLGSKKAIEELFDSLDTRVRYQKRDKIVKLLFLEVGLATGKLSDEDGYENEQTLKLALTKKLDTILNQTSLWR